MSKGLRSWVRANWVDIANPKKGGGFPKCGRSKGEKRRNYPKCVPAAKARAMFFLHCKLCHLYSSFVWFVCTFHQFK